MYFNTNRDEVFIPSLERHQCRSESPMYVFYKKDEVSFFSPLLCKNFFNKYFLVVYLLFLLFFSE